MCSDSLEATDDVRCELAPAHNGHLEPKDFQLFLVEHFHHQMPQIAKRLEVRVMLIGSQNSDAPNQWDMVRVP